MVQTTEQAGVVPHLGRLEAERLHHHFLGPEHLLVGLLRDAQEPLGLRDRGPHPIRLLVEARGLAHTGRRSMALCWTSPSRTPHGPERRAPWCPPFPT